MNLQSHVHSLDTALPCMALANLMPTEIKITLNRGDTFDLSNFANGSKVHPLCSILLHSASPAAMTALATEETSIHYMLVQLLPYAAAAQGSINKAIVALGGSTEEELPQAYQQLLLLASTSQACYTAMHITGLRRWHLLCST